MAFNNLLASPGFAAWMEGEPLDIGRLLYTPAGKPRLAVLSIAHLSDAERMFFVTLLLGEVIAWMRSQSGDDVSLRAVLYMDEIFGYFPPTANPPSKMPMLTLLKQARAYGLGVVLATQNPVDLDYKGLSNAGTWFLGRLQTERDKVRVLDGLEGASAASGREFDRAGIDRMLSGLGNRVFLMNNVHEDAPVLFQTRCTLSYLRGPLTRGQIETLMAPRKGKAPAATPAPAAAPADARAGEERPLVPPEVPERFLAARGGPAVYRPALLGTCKLHYVDAKAGLDVWEDVAAVARLGADVPPDPWEGADMSAPGDLDLVKAPEPGASFAPLPAEAARPKSYPAWSKKLAEASVPEPLAHVAALPGPRPRLEARRERGGIPHSRQRERSRAPGRRARGPPEKVRSALRGGPGADTPGRGAGGARAGAVSAAVRADRDLSWSDAPRRVSRPKGDERGQRGPGRHHRPQREPRREGAAGHRLGRRGCRGFEAAHGRPAVAIRRGRRGPRLRRRPRGRP